MGINNIALNIAAWLNVGNLNPCPRRGGFWAAARGQQRGKSGAGKHGRA